MPTSNSSIPAGEPLRCDHCKREMALLWACDDKHPMVYRLATKEHDVLVRALSQERGHEPPPLAVGDATNLAQFRRIFGNDPQAAKLAYEQMRDEVEDTRASLRERIKWLTGSRLAELAWAGFVWEDGGRHEDDGDAKFRAALLQALDPEEK